MKQVRNSEVSTKADCYILNQNGQMVSLPRLLPGLIEFVASTHGPDSFTMLRLLRPSTLPIAAHGLEKSRRS